MNTVPVLVVLVAVLGSILAATIPSHIKGCKRDDPKVSECAIKATNEIIPIIAGGYEEINIPVLDPFVIPSLVLSDNNGQGLDFTFNLKDMNIHGIKDSVVEDGSKVDIEKRTVELKLSIPTLIIDATYSINGKVLLLPITGAGDANLTLGDLKLTFDTEYTLHNLKDGKEHIQLGKSKLDFSAKQFNIYMGNLFNGDKTLGAEMNSFLNSNGQEVLKQFRPVISEAVKTIILSVVNNAAYKVPYDVLLPK